MNLLLFIIVEILVWLLLYRLYAKTLSFKVKDLADIDRLFDIMKANLTLCGINLGLVILHLLIIR